MKRAAKLAGKTTVARTRRHLIVVLSGPFLAMSSCRAALRDEKQGYEFTAAMEWRKAAELMASMPAFADRCWQQWERIMHLPRRLAQPIPALAPQSAGATLPVIVPGIPIQPLLASVA